MKLLLVAVSIIAVFTTDGRDFRIEPGEQASTTDETQLFPDGADGEGGPVIQVSAKQDQQLLENNALADGLERSDPTNEDDQMQESNELVAGEYKDQDFTNLNQQEEKIQHERKGNKSSCKAKTTCVLLGGFCVSNATLCSGRLVHQGCKGANCQCCVPGTLGNKIQSLENVIESLQSNLTNANKNLNMEMNSLQNNLTDAYENLNMEMKALKDNITNSIANIDSKQDNIRCPKSCFYFAPSNQCFKMYNETKTTWTAAVSKCRGAGLLLAQPKDPVSLRKYIVTTFGSWSYSWLDARGDGSQLKWQRDGQKIATSNSLWYPGQPGSRISTNHCLVLYAGSGALKDYPNQPLWSWQYCSSTGPYALCEYIMK